MTEEDIKALYEKYRVPEHVKGHMRAVKTVVQMLAQAMIGKGYEIDTDSLYAAALLHDVIRVCDFKSFNPKDFPQKVSEEDLKVWKKLRDDYGEIGHEAATTQILNEMNKPHVANLISKHGFLQIYNLETWEEKIMYYSDKRVNLDKIVGLKERFEAGKKRNCPEGEDDKQRKDVVERTMKLEQQFIDILGTLPI